MKFIEPLTSMKKKLSQFRYHFGKLRKNCKNDPIFWGVPGTVHKDASFQLSDITLLLKKMPMGRTFYIYYFKISITLLDHATFFGK